MEETWHLYLAEALARLGPNIYADCRYKVRSGFCTQRWAGCDVTFNAAQCSLINIICAGEGKVAGGSVLSRRFSFGGRGSRVGS